VHAQALIKLRPQYSRVMRPTQLYHRLFTVLEAQGIPDTHVRIWTRGVPFTRCDLFQQFCCIDVARIAGPWSHDTQFRSCVWEYHINVASKIDSN
jgi:hypothetical protein